MAVHDVPSAMKVPISASIPSVLMLFLASCSIGYNSKWTKAAADPATMNPKDLTGAWVGTWKSEKDGHTGKLRAIVSQPAPPQRPPQGRETGYYFLYEATWKKVLSAVIAAEHTAKWRGNSCTL